MIIVSILQEVNPALENMARNSRFDGGSSRSRYNNGMGSRFNGGFKKGTIQVGGAGRSYGAANSTGRGYDDYSRYGGGGGGSNTSTTNGNSGGGGMRHTRFD